MTCYNRQMILNREYSTNKISKWVNSCSYIMLHHTGKGSDLWLVNYLAYSTSPVSCHFVVWRDGVVYQLAELSAKTWHAGKSKRRWVSELNNHAVGIEIVSNWHEFTDKQREATRELCSYLLERLDLDAESIVRHADVAGFRGKRDVGDAFWFDKYDSREAYQLSYTRPKLSPKEREQLKLLENINSLFWEKYTDKNLRNSLHKTNERIRLLLQ